MKGGWISHKTYNWRLLMKKKLFWVRHLPLISWPKRIKRGWSLCWSWSTYLIPLKFGEVFTKFWWRFFVQKIWRPFYIQYVLVSLCQQKKQLFWYFNYALWNWNYKRYHNFLRPLEEEVRTRQIRNKGTSLISQFFKTFALDM